MLSVKETHSLIGRLTRKKLFIVINFTGNIKFEILHPFKSLPLIIFT